MPFTLADAFDRLDSICADTSAGAFPRGSSTDFLNEALRQAKNLNGGADFPSREFVSQMALMTGVYRYAAPSGMNDMISIVDQVRLPDRLDFSRKDENVFWRDFPGNGNTFAVARNKLVKSLLVNLVTIKLSTPQVDDTASLTNNGTWAAVSGTDTTNLGIDSVHFPSNKSGIKFDVDVSQAVSNAASVEKSDLPAVDLSAAAVKRVGTMTAEFYWPSSTLPTSVTLRFGSSSANYYEISVTTQIDGQAFVRGLNQVGFDWTDVTPTGSPNDASITYLRWTFNYAASQVDVTGAAFSNLVMREKMWADVHYLSDYLVLDDDGTTLKAGFDDQNDTASTFLVDDEHFDWFVNYAAKRLFAFYEQDQDKRQEVRLAQEEIEEAMALRNPGRRMPAQQSWMDTDDLQPFMN